MIFCFCYAVLNSVLRQYVLHLVVTLYVRSGSAVPHHWNNFRLSSLNCLGI